MQPGSWTRSGPQGTCALNQTPVMVPFFQRIDPRQSAILSAPPFLYFIDAMPFYVSLVSTCFYVLPLPQAKSHTLRCNEGPARKGKWVRLLGLRKSVVDDITLLTRMLIPWAFIPRIHRGNYPVHL